MRTHIPVPRTSQRVLTTEQAARALNLSPRTLEDWRQDRRGPVYLRRSDRSSGVFYHPADLREFARSRARDPLKSKNRKRK